MMVLFLYTVVIVLDQVTKHMVRDRMQLDQSISVMGDNIRLTYVENSGMAFGIHIPDGMIFTLISIAATIAIIYYLNQQWNSSGWIKSALALILGGAVGNLIDRIAFARVVDFIDVGVGRYRWPVFNVADSAVVVGMIMLFVTMFLLEKQTKSRDSENNQLPLKPGRD
jgi:signal peptidase II